MSSNKVNQKSYFIAMMGTTLEYYDMSLYSFMAPILIPFPEFNFANNL